MLEERRIRVGKGLSIASRTPAPDWRALRAEFPIVSRLTYLNTASGAPLPRRAAEAGQAYYRDMLLEGDAAWPRWEAQRERVRERLARLLNASPGEVAFTSGASHAFTLIAALLGPPAQVVAMADEFPRVLVPFQRHGDAIALVESDPDGTVGIDRIEAAITARTRAVVTSAVMHGTGFRQDLAALGALCRARGIPLVVDATQALGIVPVDVRRDGIDILAFAGYKGTFGGHGIGAICCRRERLDAPAAAPWRSARDPRSRGAPAGDSDSPAAWLEMGIPPVPGILALGGGLELLEEIGVERVEARIHELTDFLHAQLDARGFEIASPRARSRRAGITIVRADDAPAIVTALAAAGVVVSARGAGVRVSLHVFNVEEEIDRLVEAMASIRGGAAPAPPAPPDPPI
jgi:selenocysteine lyase/cysteine desulfurase